MDTWRSASHNRVDVTWTNKVTGHDSPRVDCNKDDCLVAEILVGLWGGLFGFHIGKETKKGYHSWFLGQNRLEPWVSRAQWAESCRPVDEKKALQSCSITTAVHHGNKRIWHMSIRCIFIDPVNTGRTRLMTSCSQETHQRSGLPHRGNSTMSTLQRCVMETKGEKTRRECRFFHQSDEIFRPIIYIILQQ